MKWDLLSGRRGTTLSREETLDNATYPTAGDIIRISKTRVTCSTACPMTLCTVDVYPGHRLLYRPYTRI